MNTCDFAKWDEIQATRGFVSFIDNDVLAWYMLLDDEDRKTKEQLGDQCQLQINKCQIINIDTENLLKR